MTKEVPMTQPVESLSRSIVEPKALAARFIDSATQRLKPLILRPSSLLGCLCALVSCALFTSGAYASAPNISGSASRIITDKQTSQPFSDLDITGPSDVIVTISFPAAQGTLMPTNELFTQSGDVYTLALTNTSDAVSLINALVFRPQQNRVPVGGID